MSFIIIDEQDQSLEIQWSDDENVIPINTHELQDSYNYINIKGATYNLFGLYDIINKTQSLEIANCTVDLSKMTRRFDCISFTNCKCLNYFSNECSTSTLSLIDTSIQISQLLKLQIGYLRYEYQSMDRTDFYNFNLLQCNLDSLILTKQSINLSQLKGKWNEIIFENCILSGSIDNKLLIVAKADIIIVEQNYQNCFDSLQSLQCKEFSVSIQSSNNNQEIDLGYMSNNQKQKLRMNLCIEHKTCDLNDVKDIWESILFLNCVLRGTPSCVLNNTIIEAQFDEKRLMIDRDVYLEILKVNFIKIQLCKPLQLRIHNCPIDLSMLVGYWNSISFVFCTCYNTSQIIPGSIRAQQLFINGMSTEICNYVDANIIQLVETTNQINYSGGPSKCFFELGRRMKFII
ncbi:Hypothetical_protein [Hexamita inflata]|uniref:Hypothetical_protein n=1 Tax=Hexamita inflata TaxID=28002 RepID=A0ABP1HUU9_9EUKA